MSDLVFAAATLDDIATVVELVQAAYRGETSRRGWTTEADLLEGQRVDATMVAEVLADPDATILAVRRDASLVACCELRHRPAHPDVHFGMFAVEPTIQGGGLGRRVLAEAERIAQERWRAERMVMTVLEVRSELIEWYLRRGYAPTGETGDFPYGDERFGVPKRPDLRFVVLTKDLGADGPST